MFFSTFLVSSRRFVFEIEHKKLFWSLRTPRFPIVIDSPTSGWLFYVHMVSNLLLDRLKPAYGGGACLFFTHLFLCSTSNKKRSFRTEDGQKYFFRHFLS